MALSSPAKAGMFSQETEEVMICLLTITHPFLGEPFRLSSDPTVRISDDPLHYATVSRGNNYLFMPFTFQRPEASQDAPGTAVLTVANIDRELVPLVRSIPESTRMTIELVLASSPDIVEAALFDLEILHTRYDAETVDLTLGYQSLASEPFPWLSFTPNHFPGLFA